ncbi:ribosomal-processing cysteine protease Prp [Gottfriedia luciferensis]|uniref:ribosomal-processing cysteine protease Prp n=1 Tax=Gottfriedia luciferensis TaxID=178774 RepID=UPI000B43E280|nr:ribosomal-processing cysteine protease Prp [Gottfriedia luciferensis]
MTKITIERLKDGRISSFKISGHAFFSDYGTDIVCAGLSAVSVGTVNALEAICNIDSESQTVIDEEKGFLKYQLPVNINDDTMQKAQLILEAMIVSLQTIAASYGDYVTINE